MDFSNFFSSTVGTVCYSVLLFIAGAVFGQPVWNLISSKLPWNKK